MSQSDLDSFPLEDVVLDPERDVGAVLQTHVRESGSKALLWVIGRNDCFMHPHAGRVFAELGFDLFVDRLQALPCLGDRVGLLLLL